MAALRAFLMLRDSSGQWLVTVHREFESVLEAWRLRPEPVETVGVLHIGFERPPSHTFNDVILGHAGRLLLTPSAKFALPPGFLATAASVGQAAHLSIFLATQGWGYAISEELTKSMAEPPRVSEVQRTGWVREFLEKYQDAETAFFEASICDDSSYLANESRLSSDLRRVSGLYRFNTNIGEHKDDPCAVAAAAPPWLLDQNVTSLDLTVRISNVFSVIGIRKVSDLAAHTLRELLDTQNFGRRSVGDLLVVLDRALEKGPPEYLEVARVGGPSFLQSINQALASDSERDRDIVRRRMGLDCPMETLQEIGDRYNVTRERIRQIESKVLKRIVIQGHWEPVLTAKLKALLKDREVPMPLLGIEAADPWFVGVAEAQDALRYALDVICQGSAGNIVTVNNVDYVAFMTQERWGRTISDARNLLESGAGKGWTEVHCRQLTSALLPVSGREFQELLWQEVKRYCHFVPNDRGEKVLSTYGRGVESLVEAVLYEADEPLHYTEIANRASQRGARDIEVRRAHNAAADVGLLLGRGTFGVDKHLPLNADELSTLASEAEELVSDGPPDRQWHTSEMLTGILERGSKTAQRADRYVLDIALQRSGSLTKFGRMVWSRSTDSSDVARIDVRQAIIAVLQQAGRPLDANEIRQRVVALRGLSHHFQILSADPLLRVSTGRWGLNDRDFSIKRAEQSRLGDRLVAILGFRDKAIHISELNDALSDILPPDISPVSIYSLVLLDQRVRANVAQYLYLAQWGGPRRESVSEAVENVLSTVTDPISFETIVSEVQKRIQRPFERASVSSCLQSMGATLDSVNSLWSAPVQRIHTLPEDENIRAM